MIYLQDAIDLPNHTVLGARYGSTKDHSHRSIFGEVVYLAFG
jgi:hypothetical protein